MRAWKLFSRTRNTLHTLTRSTPHVPGPRPPVEWLPAMDMKKLMKQMQQAQVAAAKIQENLAAQTVEGTASGLVTVTMNGHGKVTGLKIKPEAVDPDDVEALEDLLLVALQDANAKAEALQQEATRGLGLPGF